MIEYIRQNSFLIYTLAIIGFFLYVAAKSKKLRQGEMIYESGHPVLKRRMLGGQIILDDKKLYFKSYDLKQVYFEIPLDKILESSTEANGRLRPRITFPYVNLVSFGRGGSLEYLIIKYLDENQKEQTLSFSGDDHFPYYVREQILKAHPNLLK